MSTPEDQPRRPYRQGEALKDALAALNRAPARPSVTISRDGNGNYSYDVRVVADDVRDAADEAVKIELELRASFGVRQPDSEAMTIELSRNAKGETQMVIKGKGEEVADEYERMRGRFPLADGTAGHDKPKAASK